MSLFTMGSQISSLRTTIFRSSSQPNPDAKLCRCFMSRYEHFSYNIGGIMSVRRNQVQVSGNHSRYSTMCYKPSYPLPFPC